MDIRFSIIIPHKNIPDLLVRCLNSMPRRDDLQIIIVDDNSIEVDTIERQIKDIGYSSIEFYRTKKAKGAGYARNVGIGKAVGDWLLFVDADDIVTPDLEKIFNHLIYSTSDIVYFDVCSKDSGTLIENLECKEYNSVIKNGRDNIRFNIEVPWGKAIRHAFIKQHQIRFEEVPCSNDTRFSVLCDYYAKAIEVMPIVGYCWMTRSNSLWHTQTVNSLKTRMKVMLRLRNFMKRNKEEFLLSKYEAKAYSFLIKIKQQSLKGFSLSLFVYGFYTRSIKTVFIDAPRAYLYSFIKNV